MAFLSIRYHITMATDDLRVADRAHQPKRFVFPRRSFGTKGRKRAFNPAWLDKWSWLDYKEANDHVVCFYCSRAHRRNLLPDGFSRKHEETGVLPTGRMPM